MKKLFYFLLKRYSKTEAQRIGILDVLNSQVQSSYPEQTPYGNIYNSYIEFIVSNHTIYHNVMNNDQKSLDMIKKGLDNTYPEAIKIIKDERTGKKQKRELRRLKIKKLYKKL